jgi:ribosomal protein S18 acetylase RimI-like enzyme
MNLTIRPASKEDAVLIADLSRKTFYDTFIKDNRKEDMDKFLNEQFTRGKLILEVSDPNHSFFLAYMDEQPAGYLKLREGAAPFGLAGRSCLEIARLYAAKEFIGKGIGKALMQRSIDTAMERSKEAVWLGVWEGNQRAIDFYTAWGFEKFGEWDFLLGNDLQKDWLMKKEL